MRGLNLKEIMSKSNMNQQGLNIATYGQAYLTKGYKEYKGSQGVTKGYKALQGLTKSNKGLQRVT